jgi:hypothetical protein
MDLSETAAWDFLELGRLKKRERDEYVQITYMR